MKKSDIAVGKAYANSRGSIRLVIAMGSQYKLYPSQEISDCLRYRLLKKVLGPSTVGGEYNCTRESFAVWARREVDLNTAP